MKSLLQPWQLLILILAGWINRQEQDVSSTFGPRIVCSERSSARNASCSTITSGAVWQSKARSSAEGCLSSWPRL